MDDNTIDFRERKKSRVKELNRAARKRRLSVAYKVVLGVCVVAAVFAAYFIYEKNKTFSSYEITASVPRCYAEGSNISNFDGTILYYSKDGASASDVNGNLLWNQTFDMQNPMTSMCGGTVAFADYGGSEIYMVTSAGVANTVHTDMPIRQIAVSDKNYVVAVLEDTGVTWIYMYDTNGTTIAYFRTTMEKSGYPIDIDISPSGELVGVSYYYVDFNDVKSSVAFFNFGEVGQNNIDNYVSGYNYSNSLVPVIRFLDDETAISLSKDRLSVYAGAHKPVSVSDMFINDDVYSLYYDKGIIAVMYFNGTSEAKYRLELYDDKGKVLSQTPIDFDFSDVTFGNENVIVYGDADLYIGTYSGDVKFKGQMSEPVKLIIPSLVSSKYYVITDDAISTLEFK